MCAEDKHAPLLPSPCLSGSLYLLLFLSALLLPRAEQIRKSRAHSCEDLWGLKEIAEEGGRGVPLHRRHPPSVLLVSCSSFFLIIRSLSFVAFLSLFFFFAYIDSPPPSLPSSFFLLLLFLLRIPCFCSGRCARDGRKGEIQSQDTKWYRVEARRNARGKEAGYPEQR